MISNMERLKDKFGFKQEDITVNKYFELIDLIYYKERVYIEDGDDDCMTWYFDGGERITLYHEELVVLNCFIFDLSYDMEEQIGFGYKEKAPKKN